MKRVASVLGAVAGLAVIFYASLFAFGEIYTEVVVLRTLDASGASHETRVTIIDVAGSTWVRGRPYRGWFRRIQANPFAELYRGGVWSPVRATVSRNAADAAAFEQEMCERYGLLYRFFDLIARMSTNEIPVRLDPRSARQPATQQGAAAAPPQRAPILSGSLLTAALGHEHATDQRSRRWAPGPSGG